ncbi:MAG: type IV pilus assembly protein PilM [Bacillota bacterium]
MALGGNKNAVGLEIDAGMARAVEAAGSADKPKLVNMSIGEIPEGAVEEGMIVEPREVGSALSKLWNKGSLKSRSVMLGISNQGVLVRYATIPKVPPDKLNNVIRFHAQEHLPIPLDSVVMDHQVIGETVDDEDKTMLEVLLVAARRDMLNGFLEALKLANLEPADIDVSTLSLLQTLPPAALDRTVAVVNVANGLSNILVSDRGQARLARLVSVNLGDLAKNSGYTLNNVLSINGGGSPEVRDVYTSWADSLISETRSSLNYYQNQEKSTPLEAIILNGRGGCLKGIDKLMENALGLPVRLVNPFAVFKNAAKATEALGVRAAEYAISAGLARRALGGS